MRLCASFPGGSRVYQRIQKSFGRLKLNPMYRITTQLEMAKWLLEKQGSIFEKNIFEVGTGHIPIVPIGFFLCGAKSVTTVDLHKRIEWKLTRNFLNWIASHRDEIVNLYKGVVVDTFFNDRLELLCRYQNKPFEFFKEAKIDYLAPMDASSTNLPQESIDYHFSITTLEHIPPKSIKPIFREAKRILKADGLAIHFIDLSDHFKHQDSNISGINFLQFNEFEWDKVAGNEFAYCNRLRASDYMTLFTKLGFSVCRYETKMDKDAMKSLTNGFILDKSFSNYSLDDLCTNSLKILLTNDNERE